MLEIYRADASLVAELVTANSDQSIRMQTIVNRVRVLESGTLDHETRMAYYNTLVADIATAGRHQAAIDSLVEQLDSNSKFGGHDHNAT